MGCHKFKHPQSISVASRVIACRQNTAQTMNRLQIVDLHCCRAIETAQIMDLHCCRNTAQTMDSLQIIAVETQRKPWIHYKSLPSSKHSAKYGSVTNHGFVTNHGSVLWSMLSSNRVNAGVECREYKRRAVNYDVISYIPKLESSIKLSSSYIYLSVSGSVEQYL